MSRQLRTLRRAVTLTVLAAALAGGAVFADQWLVYIGGGLQPVEDGWTERRGQVIFTQPGGTLVSVPAIDVDLAASAIVTWQLGGRRRVPPRAALPDAPPEPEGGSKPPCVAARMLGLRSGETLEVATAGQREIVHVACLDAPETQHKFPELGWFGRATLSAVQLEVRNGASVCLTEHVPPQRDGEGHRVVFVTLDDGRDYTAEVIAGGLGLLRPGACARAAYYRQLEDRAIATQRGLWGQMSARPAFQAASHSAAMATGPPPPRRRAGGG